MPQLPDQRALVLARLLKGKVSREEAALLLGLSARSIRRLSARLLAEGPAALVHGNSGRRPVNAIDPGVAARVVAFANDGYAGLNDTHLSELLAEREGIAVSPASAQRILRGAGIESPRKRRAPRFRSRHERRAAEGMLVQLDQPAPLVRGSGARALAAGGDRRRHEQGVWCRLLGAGGRRQVPQRAAPGAQRTRRASRGVQRSPQRLLDQARAGETLEDERGRERQPTQVGRAFAELRVEMIFASSPQANGGS